MAKRLKIRLYMVTHRMWGVSVPVAVLTATTPEMAVTKFYRRITLCEIPEGFDSVHDFEVDVHEISADYEFIGIFE